MLPPPAFLISGTAYFTARKMALSSTAIWESQSSSDTSTAPPLPAVSTSKALLKRISKRPHFSTARSTIILMSECRAHVHTDHVRLVARRPYALRVLLGHRLVYVGDEYPGPLLGQVASQWPHRYPERLP